MTVSTSPLFDSHAHLTSEQFPEEERGEVLSRALASGVSSIMNVATDLSSLEAGWQLQKKAGPLSIVCAASTTPHDISGADDPFFSIVRDAARSQRLSAIGETGFEFLRKPDSKEHQETAFLRYAILAKETTLPLIVHCREAFPTFLGILSDLGNSVRGVLHCFTGTKDDAKALLDLGWYISLSGIVTFPKSESLRDVARFVPHDRLLIETDSPYLAPQRKRGLRNEPAYLRYTVETIAEVKNTTYEAIANASFTNAYELFMSNNR
jgi:TatD DNase family protein